MGLAKRLLEEIDERLFVPSEDRVCKHHVHEEWLRSRLESAICPDACAVCGAVDTFQVELDDLLDFLVAAIRCWWGRAIDDLFHDPEAESGYAGPPVSNTEELVRDEMYDDLDQGLVELVAERLLDEQWYDPSRIWLEGRELLQFSWSQFSEWVRAHDGPLDARPVSADCFANEAADGIAPERMLTRLKEIVDEFGLVVSRDVAWLRACHLRPDESPSASRLGTAPLHLAKQSNRNSPAGVAMFYGSLDADTALQEIGEPDGDRHWVVGKWKATRPLVLLDLTIERELPSFYDVEHRSVRQGLQFLRDFSEEVSRSLGPSDPGVAYRPTQALTAYMRDAIPSLDGIVYRSSRTGRDCCTLFVSNEQCVEDFDGTHRLTLVLVSITAG